MKRESFVTQFRKRRKRPTHKKERIGPTIEEYRDILKTLRQTDKGQSEDDISGDEYGDTATDTNDDSDMNDNYTFNTEGICRGTNVPTETCPTRQKVKQEASKNLVSDDDIDFHDRNSYTENIENNDVRETTKATQKTENDTEKSVSEESNTDDESGGLHSESYDENKSDVDGIETNKQTDKCHTGKNVKLEASDKNEADDDNDFDDRKNETQATGCTKEDENGNGKRVTDESSAESEPVGLNSESNESNKSDVDGIDLNETDDSEFCPHDNNLENDQFEKKQNRKQEEQEKYESDDIIDSDDRKSDDVTEATKQTKINGNGNEKSMTDESNAASETGGSNSGSDESNNSGANDFQNEEASDFEEDDYEQTSDIDNCESSISADSKSATMGSSELYTESDENVRQKSVGMKTNEVESDTYWRSGTDQEDIESDMDYFERVKDMKTFDILLTPEEWKSLEPSPEKPNKLVPGWTDVFAQKFNEIIPSCVLKFEYQNIIPESKVGGNYFGSKAVCKHKRCGKFKFIIKCKPQYEQNCNVTILVLRPVIRHTRGEIKKQQLKGEKRKKAQEQLKTQTPSSLHNTQFGEMPEEEIISGNYTKCQSEPVYRKAKSEWIVHDVLHKDPFTELVLTQSILRHEDEDSSAIKGYIQEIGFDPFMVVLYKEMSIDVAKYKIRSGDGIFHLDATWSLAKKVSEKRLLYYALVAKSSGGESRAVPVLEFITDHHGTYYISRPLLTFLATLVNPTNPSGLRQIFHGL